MGEKGKFYVRQDIRIIAALTLFSLLAIVTLSSFLSQLYLSGTFLGFYVNLVTIFLLVSILIYFRVTAKISHFKIAITSLGGMYFLYLTATGGFENTGILWCYVFPPLSFYILGQRAGLAVNLFVIAGYSIILFLPGFPFYIAQYNPAYPFRFVLSMVFVTIIVLFLEYSRERAKRQQVILIDELQGALADVKTLSGLLPICSECKKIRNDSGYWDRLETYLEKHSDAEFTHSICEECAEKLYGDKEWFKDI